MNKVKFRPVGRPSAAVVMVNASQSKQAIYGRAKKDGSGYHPAQGASMARVEKVMLRNGYVRAGVRA